ncbi:MAG: metallophosphoesterase [Candidatus Melainabacteria bacterium]|nr:metallophosphoesterase [Candidatus Melainabacteria bacterium]
MSIWVLSDIHLAFGAPQKTMEAFGASWENYAEKIAANWKKMISPDDLVLIPGDISWAMRLEEALIDLKWIDALPGTKIILRGNHDYWWPSSSKLAKALPPSIQFIQNNAITWKGVAIGGSRLWDTKEYTFNPYIEFKENPRARIKTPEERANEKEEDERIFVRELERLKLSLSQMDKNAKLKIAMTHYPPIGADLAPSRVSAILEEFKIDICVFGHLHNVRPQALKFKEARGVKYVFASCDYLDFVPIKLV